MPRHFPVPHQLNAARGCVGKSGLESLWRPRGASAQNTNLSTSKSESPPYGQGRRARRSSMSGKVTAIATTAVPDTGVPEPEIQDQPAPEPEIQDQPAPEPELDDSGHPDPDVPEPEIPVPEIPEPEIPEPAKPVPEPSRVA